MHHSYLDVDHQPKIMVLQEVLQVPLYTIGSSLLMDQAGHLVALTALGVHRCQLGSQVLGYPINILVNNNQVCPRLLYSGDNHT